MMVVDPRFFSSYKVDLAIVRNSLAVADGNLSCVLDVNGNVIFIIKDKNFSLHDRHILLDASEIPILTFQKKHRSIHRRWQAFRSDSTSAKDLIFSTKKRSVIQRVTELSVFLSDNKEEVVSDYKVAGDWKKRSCTVYSYDGSTILAQMHDNIDPCIEADKDTYGISVSPNVDYALVVALMVILYEVNKDRKKKKIKGKMKGSGRNREIKDDNDDSDGEKEEEDEDGDEDEDEEEEEDEEDEEEDDNTD
ncbi:putative tubby-like protein [Helianthus annuus]|uniref:Putative tubby C-terminal-like domain-containing protein n=1 Tax=Helianthus annuus TaxID=4232 RepID=A0A251TMC8_HELAN|nr:protein LURP-one-related 15 [Helianthus annuus]KAF5782834.1 putative tubby-like protein [Helianthus annuus]KAJ0502285.1 putative tubby-like protein [Helianthus annuus]KAJ0510303.1 putative tubby-like protein [Helianthus annuus]KAJ0518205.1 putative tubby-like protein [Helianthus annuus]KAJ0686236.1 putative tubby-like protein [Helianthus annuus]